MVGEHMAHRACSFTLEGTEEIVELQNPRKESNKSFSLGGVGKITDSRPQDTQTQQLARIEELLPGAITPSHRLPGVVPVLQFTRWQDKLTSSFYEFFFRHFIEFEIKFVDWVIALYTFST
jgi:hypothetical protein